MAWCICVLCLAASLTGAQDWSEINAPLTKIEQGLSLIESSTIGISDYFESERQRLLSDQTDLDAEKLSLSIESERLKRESDTLLERGLALDSRETALEKRGKSLDAREARAARTERILRWVPVAVLVLAGGGYALGRAAR